MSKPKKSIYLRLEAQILADEHGGVMHRWRYGRELLAARAGRRQLPAGMIKDLVAAARAANIKLSEREVQRRAKFASVYTTDQQVRQILADLGSWSAIAEAGFPEVTVDEDALIPEEQPEAAPDEWEQMSLIPGFKPVLKIRGQEIPLAQTTVGDVVAYRDKYRQMHEGFGKTLALVEVSVDAILEGAGGDMEANALESWKRATEREEQQ